MTEPNTGSNTLQLQTQAIQNGDRYEITGSKSEFLKVGFGYLLKLTQEASVWISTAQQAHKILLLARTSPLLFFYKSSDAV